VSPMVAILIGAIAGVIIPLSVVFFDKIKIDDPVGATSVHLVCGIWGTLAVGIFVPDKSFLWQAIGCFSIVAFSFVFSFILMSVLKATIGVRVSEEEEIKGLDISEHEMEAYQEKETSPVFGYSVE
jgi:Amt family ammonium transporter